MQKIIKIGLVSFISLLILFSPALAQETAKESTIWEKESLTAEIKVQKELYVSQVEKYRTDYKNYQIAKDQFETHQTLTSIEEVTKVTKAVMLSRDEVLITHLYLTKLKLIEAEGVELSQKNLVLAKIDGNYDLIKQHQQKVTDALDRDTLNQLADDFKTLGEQSKQISYHSATLLSISSLQTVQDKARALKDDLANLSGVSTELLKNSEKNRAVNETTRVLDQAQVLLIETWSKISNRKEDSGYTGLYDNINRELDPIYVNLAKAVSYLKEFLII